MKHVLDKALIGSANEAKCCLLIDIRRQWFIVVLIAGLRVEQDFELRVSIEGVTDWADLSLAGARALTAN